MLLKSRHFIIYILLQTLLFPAIYGQKPDASFPFDHFTVDAGLSYNTVHTIMEDELGMIWMGTRFGLNRFDGYEFKVFLPDENDSSSLRGHTIYCLWEDAEGNIWVGHRDAGIRVLERKTGSFVPPPFDGDASVDWQTISVRAIFQDSKGHLWIGTFGGGVVVFSPSGKRIRHLCTYCDPEGYKLSNDFVFDFEEDPQGRVWIGTAGDGVSLYDPAADKCLNLFSAAPEAKSGFGKSLCLDQQGNLWVGTAGNGIYAIELQSLELSQAFRRGDQPNKGLSHNMVTDLERDAEGNIWISTDGGGLNRFSPETGQWEYFQYNPAYPNSLNTDAIYDVMFDRRGNLWVGTFNGGVNLHSASQPLFETNRQYGQERIHGLRSVLCVDQDPKGNLWLGTDGGGLLHLSMDSSPMEYIPLPDALKKKLPEQVITSLTVTPSGNLWLGTFAQGLRYVNPKSGEVQTFQAQANDPSSLSHNNVWDLALTSEGGLWIGTLGGGLNYLAPNQSTFKRYMPDSDRDASISGVQIVDILLDKQEKNLWIATENEGLNRLSLESDRVSQYHHQPTDSQSLSSEQLRCVFEDHEGNIWIGTEHAGLNVLSPSSGSFKHFGIEEGLPSKMINSIVQGPDSGIWISTQAGIVKWDPHSGKFIDIGSEPYLKNNQYNQGAALRLEDGRLFFGSTNGYSLLLPEQLKKDSQPPQVVFTDFSISGQSIPIGEFEGRTILTSDLNDSLSRVYLSYKDKGITFRFSATSYSQIDKNQYAYRLLNFDPEWRYLGAKQNFVTFSTLPGGTYQLEVKAANRDGVWSENPRTLTLIVAYPFWQRWWFILLCMVSGLLLFAGILLAIINRQKNRFKQQRLQSEQEILRLKNENLEKDIAGRQAKLSASVLQIAHKNEILNDIKGQLQGIKLPDEEGASKGLRRVLREINSELKEENYWEQFQLVFNQTHTNFVESLQQRHPNLSNNEKRLCCFIRMQLSNREIASILNVTINAVEQAKYRMKKKIDLPRETPLDDYLQTIDRE